MTATLPEGFRLQACDVVDSTNARALAAARAGDPGKLWVTGREQTAGRGRRGRTWSSPRGNLYASLLLVGRAAPSEANGTVSLLAAVALDQALIDVAGPAAATRMALKWPNDILCDGRKVAGILVEAEDSGGDRYAVAIGIGVNCRSHPTVDGMQPAGDLAALGLGIDPEVLFARLAERMAAEIDRWDGGRNFAAIRDRWLKRAAGLGAAVRVMLPGGEAEGTFETVDATGRMIVRKPDGSRMVVSSGDASVRLSRGDR